MKEIVFAIFVGMGQTQPIQLGQGIQHKSTVFTSEDQCIEQAEKVRERMKSHAYAYAYVVCLPIAWSE